jgi:hypothetical protein
MKNRYLATLILSIALLCSFISEKSKAHAAHRLEAGRRQAQTTTDSFTAVVKADEARFTLPVPERREWKWRLPETKDSAQEYRMDVTVKNGGTEYTFGFYLWKRAGAKPGTGSFSDLLDTGQKSVFERPQGTRRLALIRDAGVKVNQEGDRLVITVSGRKDVARLFSGKPEKVTFKIAVPGDNPRQKTVPVDYTD